MHLVFLAIEHPDKNSGVFRKICNQVRCLRDAGHQVQLYFVVYDPTLAEKYQTIDYTEYSVVLVNTSQFPFVSKFINRARVFRFLRTILQKSFVHFIYFRYPHYLDVPFYSFTRFFKHKVVLESQTKERAELRSRKKYFKALLDFVLKKRVMKNLFACISVTEEIANYQKNFDPSKQVIFKTIGNGIDVDLSPVAKKAPLPKQELHLVYIGNLFPHHGLDRLIRGIASYQGRLKVTLRVVGDGPEKKYLQQLVNSYNLSESVFFSPPQSGRNIDDLFDWAHLGIGALGIHRKGLAEASVLKVREYAARGLPFVTCGNDPDLDDTKQIQPYLHKVPMDETNIEVEQLIDFANKIYSSDQQPFDEILRSFSKKNLDMKIKMNELISILNAYSN